VPEGDVLRRTAARLDAALAGRVLVRAELRWPTAGGVDLVGRTVLGTEPYGKHLFTRFDDGRTLHTHLRMDGTWAVRPTGSASSEARRPTVRAVLANDRWTAVGNALGMLDVVATRDERRLIAHLGPDVLADDFPEAGLAEGLARLAAQGLRPVAESLLDQRVVAGLGTIFTAESLFARGTWPWTPSADLADSRELLLTARRLLRRSVAARVPGTTGEVGRGRTTWVHGRERMPCRRCGTPIAVGQAGDPPMQRPIFFCPRCQAAP
jgi:endonuclease-8